MGTIWYLYKKSFKNRIKKAVKKPITYFAAIFVIFYIFAVPWSFNMILDEMGWRNAEALFIIFTLIVFWMTPANFISYAKRKGLLFRNSDIHFLFTSPVTPKKILLYAHIRNLFVYVIMTIFVMLAAIFMFRMSLWQALAYFVVAMILQNILESSVMILLYGSEKIGDRGKKVIEIISYVLIAVFFVIAFVKYTQMGLSTDMVMDFLLGDEIQMVPVVGWYISAVNLIFMGPTTVNIVCTVLYVLFTLVMFVLAIKMPCSGEYYEDAMKFAEDYQVLLQKRQDGLNAKMGKKEKFGKAKVEYKGGGAKALFYKQLLEYKKCKFFFFDTQTVIMLALGAFMGYIWGQDMIDFKEFILPISIGYVAFCMSAVGGKWSMEIKSPYTFLIPDSPMKKLWYATAMEHIKSIVCGALYAVPAGIILKLPAHQIALAVVFFVCLQACKIYNTIMAEVMVGNVMGKTGKQLFVMLLQGLVLGIAATAAIIGVMSFNIEIGYLLMIGALVLLAFALMTVANICFDKMEIVE